MPDYKKHKERIEVLLDPVKDAHIIQFLNENARTRAGFIRQLLNDRAREIGYGKVSRKQVEREPETQTKPKEAPKKKRLSGLTGTSFSSKSLLKDDENEK
ncbi:hypothetical protein J26TS2_44960 [Shouchella clausii]|nr:hypothetical protein J26TS2_44960 [Shouchella clausii]